MPSLKFPRVQLPDETVHDTSADPLFDAVTFPVAVSPVTLIVGVFTFVIRSEFDRPESDAAASVGVAGVGIVTVLMTTLESAVEDGEVSGPTVCVAANEYVPFGRVEKVQDPEAPVATKVHVIGVPMLGVAVIVTEAPVINPEAILVVGVLSDV